MYVQGFDFESITFKEYVNIFEGMKVAESIYKGVVELSYKKPTGADAKRAVHSRKMREEATL